ncbi:MAG: MarR family transcriptional regulator [Promethearchaeota archaeon]
MKFQDLPSEIQKLFLDLEKDSIIEIKEDTGFRINDRDVFLNGITNFKSKEGSTKNLLKIIMGYFQTHSTNYFFFKENIEDISRTFISSAKKEGNNVKKSGDSGDEPLIVPQKGSRGREREGYEIVKKIPLDDIGKRVIEPIKELGVGIDPNTIIHFGTLTYRFKPKGRDKELYEKIIDNLGPSWDKRGWAWPVIYLDSKYEIKPFFSIRMHEHGRLIVSLKRGSSIKRFFHEFYRVMNFLSPEEFVELLNLFYLESDASENDAKPYFHLANAVTDENEGETVADKLDGAKFTLRFIDHLGFLELDVEADESCGYYEIEIKGRAPESLNLNSIFATPNAVTGTFRDIASKAQETIKNIYDLKQGQTVLYNDVSEVCQTLELVKEEVVADISEIKAKQFGHEIQHDLALLDIKSLFNTVLKGIRDHSTDLEGAIILLDKGIHHIKESVQEYLGDFELDIASSIQTLTKKHELTHQKIETLDTKLSTKLDKLDAYLQKEFKSLSSKIETVLDQIDLLPGITISELEKNTNIPRTSLLYYLNKLQKKGLIQSQIIRSGQRGRPPKQFTFTEKLKKLFKTKKEGRLN